MSRLFNRLGIKAQLGLLLGVLAITVAIAAAAVGHSLVIGQALNESRSVADMAEHIGAWGSRYGGVSVKLQGLDPAKAGTYLEQRLYASGDKDLQHLSGVQVADRKLDAEALKRMDAYYSKNPALIQREVADISAASGRRTRFRITAKSVINQGNAPNEFEIEALNALQDGNRREYFSVKGTQMMYARSMVATAACLKCHASQSTTPGYIKANAAYSGGGGFGYVEGKPAGVIAVYVSMMPTAQAAANSLSPAAWASLAAVLMVILMLVWFVARKVVTPASKAGGKPSTF